MRPDDRLYAFKTRREGDARCSYGEMALISVGEGKRYSIARAATALVLGMDGSVLTPT